MTTETTRPGLRIALATVIALDLIGYSFFIEDARARAEAAGTGWGWLTGWVSTAPGRASLVLIGLASALWFARRPGRIGAAAIALGSLVLLSTAHTQLFGSPWRHLFFSGLCLLGWMAGLALARKDDLRIDETYAVIGARALLAGAYLSSSLSKLVYGGIDWANGTTIQASVISQTGLVADSWLNAYRVWVAYSPNVAAVLSVGTIVIEGMGPALLGPRWIRMVAALALVSMHFNIFLLTGIPYWEASTMLLVFGLPFREPSEHPSPGAGSTALLGNRVFIPFAVLLGAVWIGSVVHQANRYHSRTVDPPGAEDASAEPEPKTAAQVIGPFTVGSDLAGWSIASLGASADAFVVEVQGPPGSIEFALTCSQRPQSPFDLGDVHIVREGDTPTTELEGIGRALQEQVERATAGADPCERVQAWQQRAAQAE